MDSRPQLIDEKYGQNIYDANEWDAFFDAGNINYSNSDITGKTIYVRAKTISQNKLRDAGFKITREPAKADVVVISDFDKAKDGYSYGGAGTMGIRAFHDVESFFDIYDSSSVYILDKDLYKYIYKYEGNQELFVSCMDLLKSNVDDNVKMAMEFISNANWADNEIYLREIFNMYWYNYMRSNSYKTSISFKGFLNSLHFNHEDLRMNDASDYRNYCKNEEHHQWVYNKYESEFKIKLDDLVSSYKIKIDKIEYSIDKSLIYEEFV